MKSFLLPNRLFIKLLLGFWLCSSLIIVAVGMLPLLQQNHDRAPMPPHLRQVLSEVADELKQQPSKLNGHFLHHWERRRSMEGKPIRIYLVNDQGQIINTRRVSRGMRRFMLMADEATTPISHQFRDELIFGPFNFEVEGKNYGLYGRLPDHHPMPWFFFFIEHKLLTVSLAILLSGLLCGLLAWHLGKPLRSLKQSANALAQGQLSNRVDDATAGRHDEMGELAQAFNSMAAAIETMVNNQQRLISDISHELRTPLTRLQLALALTRKKGQASTEIKRIGYEAEQLEAMIAELLELSRVKLDIHEHKHKLSLAETLGQVLDDAEFEAEQQQKSLLIDIDDSLMLMLNPRPLARAVENLLRNAIRYAEREVSIRAYAEPERVILSIRDDGPGIDNEADLQAIFEPFYRPQSARERESGGWGLGLAIAKAAIQAHQGQIVANNATPHGLEVIIRLPR
ncbi:ATP-binding protein [Shewanella algae]|uniref:ATP-binding protein n=1 Tax=Shewanella algae TaxID=38313 RepID=UPI001F35C057|nr:ATP-binding protein [Shewanella algae]MCE9778832.1 ATP-binding protein [Shewanella algae]MCE9824621.1 ATP-binding protein [Shewanella algae]